MRIVWTPAERELGSVDLLGLTGLVGLLVARFIPVARLLPFWGCIFRKVTGWPCLGCGLTRAADHAAHLHFARAWHANPLGTLGAIGFALLAVLTVVHLAFGVRVPVPELDERDWRWARVVLVLAVLVNYAYVVMQTRYPGWAG